MGGSTTSESKLPKYVQDADKANMARAQQTANIGYTPYYGPDVAAFAPQQVAAMQNNNQAADAFGMATTPLNIMPAQQFDGGIMGYSSGGMYDQAVSELERRNPGQVAAIRSMFIDPVTGAPPSNQALLGVLDEVAKASSPTAPRQQGDRHDPYNSDRMSGSTQGYDSARSRSVTNATTGNGGIY